MENNTLDRRPSAYSFSLWDSNKYPKMKTAIIIEDEIDAQLLLSKIIEEYCPDIKIVAVASNIFDGKVALSLQPDILFLDVQLGTDLGFDILNQLKENPFKLIITTAYEKYALEAFKHNAIDYILKPYSPKSVKAAVKRADKIIQDGILFEKLNNSVSENSHSSKLSLATADGFEIIDIGDIINVEANRSYSVLHLQQDRKLTISKSLKEVQSMVSDRGFYRTHTSHLINLQHLVKYCKEDGGFLVMSNHQCIPISRRKKAEFLNLLKTSF